MFIVVVILTLILGFVFGFFLCFYQSKSNKNFLVCYIDDLKLEKTNLSVENDKCKEMVSRLNSQLVVYERDIAINKIRQDEQKQEVIEVRQKLVHEFENLANRIFEEKSNKFSQQNQINLGNLLTPLNEKIKNFETKVNDVYEKENKERISLRVQVEELSKLNKLMNQETQNLTKALKGDSKVQGNWGEMILESILEKSGLIKGREYVVQDTYTDDIGKRFRPDVIINLPDNKSLVVDSKVSLTAYEKLVSATNDVEYKLALKEHIQSIKNHIKGLSDKNYHKLYNLHSLDFVLMFVPIEVAFTLALQTENAFFDDALNKNIIIVCPSTLLATVRTVYSVWRTEKSVQNAHEIAKIGGELYDRFIGFLTDLEKINDSINSTQKNYDNALIKLQGNKGVVKSAMKLKELGAKSSKVLGNNYTCEITSL